MMSPAMRWASEPCSRERLAANSGSASISVGSAAAAAARGAVATTTGAGASRSRRAASGRTGARGDELDDRVRRFGDARHRADEMHAAVRQARPQRQRDVDAGLGELAVEGERVVEQQVAFGPDAQGRRKIGQVGGQRTGPARALLGREIRRVEVPEPAHLLFRQAEAAVAVKAMRREVHLRRIGAVDRHEAGEAGAILARQPDDRHRGEIGAGRIAGDEHRAARTGRACRRAARRPEAARRETDAPARARNRAGSPARRSRRRASARRGRGCGCRRSPSRRRGRRSASRRASSGL